MRKEVAKTEMREERTEKVVEKIDVGLEGVLALIQRERLVRLWVRQDMAIVHLLVQKHKEFVYSH